MEPIAPSAAASPPAAVRAGLVPVTHEECERAVREIAKTYATPAFEGELDPSFPYRGEFLDSLRRAGMTATHIELRVESIESVAIAPWVLAGREEKDGHPLEHFDCDCIADARSSTSFDDVGSGRRVVGPVGRGQWRIRFQTTLAGSR